MQKGRTGEEILCENWAEDIFYQKITVDNITYTEHANMTACLWHLQLSNRKAGGTQEDDKSDGSGPAAKCGQWWAALFSDKNHPRDFWCQIGSES